MPGLKSGLSFNGIRGLGWEEISRVLASLWKISSVVPVWGCCLRIGGQVPQGNHGEYFSGIGLKASSRDTKSFLHYGSANQ